jgi:hypothetical protein
MRLLASDLGAGVAAANDLSSGREILSRSDDLARIAVIPRPQTVSGAIFLPSSLQTRLHHGLSARGKIGEARIRLGGTRVATRRHVDEK